jgi:hypothetical protein
MQQAPPLVPNDKPFQFRLCTALVAVLVAGVLLGLAVKFWPKPRHPRQRAVQAQIQNIKTACEAYEIEWDQYPPDVGPHGETSSAALYYYLTKAFAKSPKAGELWATQNCGPYIQLQKSQIGKDCIGFPIIVDLWNRPIEYDNIRDDKSTPDGFTMRGPDDIRTDAKPRNKVAFDLFSRGDPARNEPIANFEPYDPKH